MKRDALKNTKRWVIKIGSALITDNGKGLDHCAIKQWAEQIAYLKKQGKEVVLVSSGSIAAGMTRIGWDKRPHEVCKLQAAAALGQMELIRTYENCFFQNHNIHTAQILLTHDDLANRERYLNARSALKTLLDLGVLPVINENDTVVTDEIRFGDNDTLGALVSNLIEADVLVILTDQEGVYDADPRENSDAKLIQESDANNLELLNFATSKGSLLGSGGMTTKIIAAQRAARSGTHTIICSGSQPDILKRVEQGEQVGTMLTVTSEPLQAKKQWLANQLKSKGKVFVDAGAAKVLTQKNKSLLGVGVTKIEGNFNRGELVSCIDPDGCEIAKGLINYDAQQSNKIKGLSSEKIETVLGFVDEPELINRDNLVIISK